MSQALYRKWRPARFGDVVGQEHITRTLQNAVQTGRVGHAYLFCGPRGTGKTTLARLLAKAVNCLHPDPAQRPDDNCSVCRAIHAARFLDLIEIDAASNTGVDDIRDLRDKINFAPTEGRFKVYIIDEVHMLSTAAFNALLKTLEEPPPHAKFVLATTEEHKVPLTIKSRCQQFNFRLLTTGEIVRRLEWLADREGLTLEPEALALIAREGAGSLRDAESLLDQLVMAPGETITLARAQQILGVAATHVVLQLTDAWLAADAVAGLRLIHQALSTGADARQFCRQMATHLRQVLLLQLAGADVPLDLPSEHHTALSQQAQRADRPALVAALKLYNQAALAPAGSWQPQLPLELAFIESFPAGRLVAPPPLPPPPQAKETTSLPQPTPPPLEPPPQSMSAAPPAVTEPDLQADVPLTPETSPLTLESVTAQWRHLPAQVRQRDRNLPALLSACRPLAVEGKVVIVGFDYPILKDKFDSHPDAPRLVADALRHLLSVECQVRSVVTGHYQPPTVIPRAEVENLARELGGRVRED